MSDPISFQKLLEWLESSQENWRSNDSYSSGRWEAYQAVINALEAGEFDFQKTQGINPGDKVRHRSFSEILTVEVVGPVLSIVILNGNRYDLLTEHLEVVIEDER